MRQSKTKEYDLMDMLTLSLYDSEFIRLNKTSASYRPPESLNPEKRKVKATRLTFRPDYPPQRPSSPPRSVTPEVESDDEPEPPKLIVNPIVEPKLSKPKPKPPIDNPKQVVIDQRLVTFFGEKIHNPKYADLAEIATEIFDLADGKGVKIEWEVDSIYTPRFADLDVSDLCGGGELGMIDDFKRVISKRAGTYRAEWKKPFNAGLNENKLTFDVKLEALKGLNSQSTNEKKKVQVLNLKSPMNNSKASIDASNLRTLFTTQGDKLLGFACFNDRKKTKCDIYYVQPTKSAAQLLPDTVRVGKSGFDYYGIEPRDDSEIMEFGDNIDKHAGTIEDVRSALKTGISLMYLCASGGSKIIPGLSQYMLILSYIYYFINAPQQWFVLGSGQVGVEMKPVGNLLGIYAGIFGYKYASYLKDKNDKAFDTITKFEKENRNKMFISEWFCSLPLADTEEHLMYRLPFTQDEFKLILASIKSHGTSK